MPARSLRAPFPFLETPELELHCRPGPTWERLLADLRSARRRLLFENYIIRNGAACVAVVDAICEAAGHGARVRILVDSFGGMGLEGEPLERLQEAGAEVRFFNPMRLKKLLGGGSMARFLQRTHRRIVVVDDRAAWVGGMAVDDRWWEGGAKPPARDAMLRVGGPLVEQLAARFGELWTWRWMRWPGRPRRTAPLGLPRDGSARVIAQAARRAPTFRRALYHRLATAQNRAWLGTAYFIPNRRLRVAIRNAARRGVSVRLLLPGKKIDHPTVRVASHRYYSQLLRAGVRIFEYQPAFMHEKVALFDDDWSIIGSPNLDRWSLYLNHELAIETRSRSIGQELHEQFLEDFAASEEVEWEAWRKRSRWRRFLEEFLGLFETAL